jgi:hypothetical protein
VDESYSGQLKVSGHEADIIADPKLATMDLALVTVKAEVGTAATLGGILAEEKECTVEGFTAFFKNEFVHKSVHATVSRTVVTHTVGGEEIEHLALMSKGTGDSFAKGMSGGPVYGSKGTVIAIARLRGSEMQQDGTKTKKQRAEDAHAIRITSEIIGLVEELSGCSLLVAVPKKRGTAAQKITFTSTSRQGRPQPRDPLPESEKNDDIQKGRWGGSAERGPYAFGIENLTRYSRYFVFDAVVTSSKGDLEGPFVFHLHDTYRPSIIWVRKTDGHRAICREITSTGVFTIGIQFRTADEEWHELEYDLAQYDRIDLAKKYAG